MSVVKFRDLPLDGLAAVRFWDGAATKPSKQNPDPDYTAGCLLAVTLGTTGRVGRGHWYVIEARRIRETPAKVEDYLWETHEHDDALLDRLVSIRFELEGGSSGLHMADQLSRGRFAGVDFAGRRPRVSKVERAKPFAIVAERGDVDLVEGAWHEDWLSEHELFPDGQHDDFVDCTSGAFAELAKLVRGGDGTPVKTIPRGGFDDDEFESGGWQVTL